MKGVRAMRKLTNLVMLIVIVVITISIILWAYEGYRTGGAAQANGTVHDADKMCMITADTGACSCRHRETNELLTAISYDECVLRARSQ